MFCGVFLVTPTQAQIFDFFQQPTPTTAVPQTDQPSEQQTEEADQTQDADQSADETAESTDQQGQAQDAAEDSTDQNSPTNTPLPTEAPTPFGQRVSGTPIPISPGQSLEGSDQTGVYVTDGTDTRGLRDDGFLYVGGDYTTISLEDGTQATRLNLGVIQLAPLQLLGWAPEPDGAVRTLASDTEFLFVGGEFLRIAQQDRPYIALFDKQTLDLRPWNPIPNDHVYAVAVDAEYIYVGGRFTAIGGQNRAFFAIFDRTTGELSDRLIEVNGPVRSITIADGVVFVGGDFTQVDGEDRQFIAAINQDTGELTPFDPDLPVPVRRIEVTDDGVITVGEQQTEEGQIERIEVVVDPDTAEIIQQNQVPVGGSVQGGPGNPLTVTVKVDQQKLGFTIPTLSDILTFIIRAFFIIAGLAALFYVLLGAFSWITSGGEEENVKKARDKIVAAIVGVILIVIVLAVIVTLEQIVFQSRICFGLSCAASIPDLVDPCGPGTGRSCE